VFDVLYHEMTVRHVWRPFCVVAGRVGW
jgi:hypothetical protein